MVGGRKNREFGSKKCRTEAVPLSNRKSRKAIFPPVPGTQTLPEKQLEDGEVNFGHSS